MADTPTITEDQFLPADKLRSIRADDHGTLTINEIWTQQIAGKAYDCAKCGGSGQIPYPGGGDATITCDLCTGYGKTTVPYVASTITTGYVVDPEFGEG